VPWVKLCDTFADDPRFEDVGAEGFAVHVAALCYCNRQLTDGRLTLLAARRLWPVEDAEQVIAGLLDAGLWKRIDVDTFELVDYFPDQPSREQVMAERAANKARQARHRKARNAVTNAVTNTAPALDPPRTAAVSANAETAAASPASRRDTADLTSDPPLLPPSVEKLRDELADRRVAVAWDLTADQVATVDALIQRCGHSALVKNALAQYLPNDPARSARAFITSWSALPPRRRSSGKHKPDRCPIHRTAIEGRECGSCRADRLAAAS
jgi:hypothetical protein